MTMSNALFRKSVLCSLLLALPLAQGCLTSAMWRDHKTERTYTAEVEIAGEIHYEERTKSNIGSTSLKVVLTPLTLAVDIGTLLFIIWLLDQMDDDEDDDDDDGRDGRLRTSERR